jgi:hypothetical protein
MIVAVATTALLTAGGSALWASAAGVPAIDEANANIQMGAAKFKAISCTGVGAVPYVTYAGTWTGGETDLTPGTTPYSLTGPLTISKVEWTINLSTDRGVLHGVATFATSTAAAKTYSGPITLITQGNPAVGANEPVQARGWLAASTFTNAAADGGSLLANVELQIGPGFAATGEFGNQTMGFDDYSIWTNNQVC